MAKVTINQLYDNLKEDGWVEKDFDNFKQFFFAAGEQGYKNRKALYDNMREDGYVDSPTYEDFMDKIDYKVGKSPSTSAATPMAQAVEESSSSPTEVTEQSHVEPQKPWQPSLQDKLRASWGIAQGVNNFKQGNKAVREKVKRQAEMITPEGRQKAKVAKASAKLVGADVETPLFGGGGSNAEDVSASASPQQPKAMPAMSPIVSGVKFQDGKPVTEWMLPDGTLTTNRQQVGAAEELARALRLQHEFEGRMREKGLDPSNPKDIQKQAIYEEVGQELEEAYREKEALEEALNKRKEELDKEHDNVGLGTRILRGLSEAAISSKDPHAIRDDSEARNYTADKQYNQLMAAIRHNRQAINILEDKRRGRMNEFWLNLGKEMVNGYTFDYGKGQLNDSRALNDAADLVDTINEKRRKGEALNEEEQTAELLLTSLARRNDTEGRFGGDYGAWARAGKMASHSIELLPDFAMGGMDLMGSITTKGLAKMGLNEVAKGFGNKVMRATGIGLGTLAGGAVMTNTIQAPRLLGQTAANMDGQLRMDSDGNYIIDGKEGFMTSFLKAQRELISENASEAVGEFLPSGKFVRELVGKGLEKVGLSKLNNTLASIGGKEWYQNTNIALKQMGFNGTVNEGLEEYAGIGYQTLMGDGDAFRSLADWDTHIDIWLGTVTMGALLNTPQYIGTAAYGAQYAKAKHGLNKNDKAGASVYGERWEGIKSQIDGMQNENVAGVLTTMLTDGTASSKEERQVLLDYAGSLQRMRGLNIGQMMGGSAQDAEVAQTYSSGYEASTPQEMVDAQNMYEYQRQRLVNELGSIGEENIENILAEVESDPVGALNKTYDPALRDIVMDYANAKTVRDGMIQRVNDDIDEQIAQSNAVIDGRINKESGLIVPATMGLDDRQVYVVSGNIVANDDGSIDRDASDESVIVRNAQTGELEFTDPRSLSSLGEAIDPEEERATATEAIRQQSAQAAVDAMNGTLAFNSGDVVQINDGNNALQATIIGPAVDEKSGMPVEGQVVVQLPDGQQTVFTKEQLQAFADAANLERINVFEQERAAARAQQQLAEAEANYEQGDSFKVTIENSEDTQHAIVMDQEGEVVTIWTPYPINERSDVASTMDGYITDVSRGELEGIIERDEQGNLVDYVAANPKEEIVGNAVITEDNSVNLQHGNGPEQNNDERAQPREADGGPVAPDPAGSLETSRDRSDIRVYEDGLAAKYNDYSEHSERDRREAESERLVGIAKSKGQYYDRKRIETLGEKRPKPSGESEIYVDAPKRRIYKVKNPYAKSPMKGNVQPEDAIYEHLVHNKYFPDTAYKFEGISDDLGDARIVLSQELVESVGQATKEQIDAALAEKGLLPEGKYTYGNDEISVTDVTGDNALLGNDGKVYFIDPIINFKKPVREILRDNKPAAEAAAPNQAEEMQPTALSRIPVDEEGEPLFDQTDPATAWDGMTEYFGDPEDAIEFARSKVKTLKNEKDKLAKAVDNIKATGSAKEFKDAKAKARASLAAKQAQLDHWNNVVNAKIAREQADAEAQRLAVEAERERNRQAYLAAENERRQQEEARRQEQERKATLDAELAAEAERQSLLPETQEQSRAANSFDGYIEQMRQEILSRGAGEQRQRLNERIRTASGAKQYGEIYAALSEEQGPVASLEEWVTRQLSVNKQRVKWTGEGNLRGQIFAAGKKEKVSEVKQLQWMISDREGIPFWDFVHKMWETLSADDSAGFNREAVTDQDVRNMVIDVLRSHPTSRSLFESAIDMYDTRMASDTTHGELQEMEHDIDDIRDQWYRDNFGMEYDEYRARVEAIYSEIRRSELTDEDIDAINSEIADEQQNINDNGTDNERALRSGAESVQAEQSDERAGDAPADVERPETAGRGSDSESGSVAAEAEAQQKHPVAGARDRSIDEWFGPVYTEFRGKPEAAERFLRETCEGVAKGALSYPGLSPIDLVWGDNKAGYMKIIVKHPEVAGKLQEILNRCKIIQHSDNRIVLESEKHKVIVSKMKGATPTDNWLLTAYHKKEKSVSASSSDIETEPGGKRNGTATPQNELSSDAPANTTDTGKTLTGNGNDTATPENAVNSSESKDNALLSDKQGDSEKSLPDKIAAAEAEVNTDPTDAQKEAGNYKMGHVKIDGLDISIENPKGSIRSGKDANGKSWETKMNNTYGYIRGTTGVDGDKIDVFLSENPAEGDVYVVDQYNPDDSFDEHKVMYGFASADEAKGAYLSNYSADWADGRKIEITGVTREEFRKWLDASDRKTKPFAEYKSVKPINPSGNKLVTDERYAELRERMRKKFGQLNMGVDPEILAIGTEMAVYHIEKGARKFTAYASAMIADLGDAVRPYLKAFYNAVRDMPEAEAAGLIADMDSYEDVRKVDIANFDKTSIDAMATAAAVVEEQKIAEAAEDAGRLNSRVDEYVQRFADFLSIAEEDLTQEAEDSILREREALTQEIVDYYLRQGVSIEAVEKQAEELIGSIQSQTSAAVARKLQTEENVQNKLAQENTDEAEADRAADLERERAAIIPDEQKEIDEATAERNEREADLSRAVEPTQDMTEAEREAAALNDATAEAAAPETKTISESEDNQPSSADSRKDSPKSKGSQPQIDDFGEKIAGARKDMLSALSRDLDNVTERALVELPLSKAIKRPDFSKAIETGAMTQEEAFAAEALWQTVYGSKKPAATRRNAVEIKKWASYTYQKVKRLQNFIEADSTERQDIVKKLQTITPADEETERAYFEKIKGYNSESVFAEPVFTPDPAAVAFDVMNRMGVAPDEKVNMPYRIIVSHTKQYYEAIAANGERMALPTTRDINEAVEEITLLCKMHRGDEDIIYPDTCFRIYGEKPILKNSGKFEVTWFAGRRGMDYKHKEFTSKEAAESHVATLKEKGIVSTFFEKKESTGEYESYRIKFINPINREATPLSEAYQSKADAQTAIAEKIESLSQEVNATIAKSKGAKTKAKEHFFVATIDLFWKRSYAVCRNKVGLRDYVDDPVIKEFDTRAEAEAWFKKNKDALEKQYADYLAKRRAFVYFDQKAHPRVGEDYRKGEDVTPEQFSESFGFRGVQFGNWTNGNDRQAALNEAYDAFMDLARVTGLSPRALSLNGELGLAFGARGSGSANAHYESSEVVINLTKTRGAGSLAHEWWHALDNYFMRKEGVPAGYATSMTSENMRPELRQAFKALTEAISRSEFGRRSDMKGEYWGRMIEKTARLFGEWVVLQLEKKGQRNHFLSRGIDASTIDMYRNLSYFYHKSKCQLDGRTPMSKEEFMKTPESLMDFPYPTPEELEAFDDKVQGIFDTLHQDTTGSGVILSESRAVYSRRRVKRSTPVVTAKNLFDFDFEEEVKTDSDADRVNSMVDDFGRSMADFLAVPEELVTDEMDETIHKERETLKRALQEYYSKKGSTAEEAEKRASELVAKIQAEVSVRTAHKSDAERFATRKGAGAEESYKTAGGEEVLFNGSTGLLPKLREGEYAMVERRFAINGGFDFSGKTTIESADDVAFIFRTLESYGTEQAFGVLVKDGKPTIIHVGSGSAVSTVVDLSPLRVANDMLGGADAIWLVHNHPSGTLKASPQDANLQRKLELMFPGKMQDAIIMDTKRGLYATFDTGGKSTERQRKDAEGNITQLPTYSFSGQVFAEDFNFDSLTQVRNSQDVAAIVAAHRLGESDKTGVLLLNNANKVVGNILCSQAVGDAELPRQIADYALSGGATRVIIYGRDSQRSSALRKLKQQISELSGDGIALLDSINIKNRGSYESAADNGVLEPEAEYGRDKQGSNQESSDTLERQGDGYGAYSDAEVSYLNDTASKLAGKNRFSKKRQAEFAARERQRMADRIQELAEHLHLNNVEVMTDTSQLEGKRAEAKGFFNKRTGKITIVLPNNYGKIDAEQTLLHEAVAHYGLRKLFGKHFDTFLNNVYESAEPEIRRKIAAMAAKYGWDFRTATEEYLAGLAEDTNFDEARAYGGWWSRIKRLFLDMLEKIGFEGFRDNTGIVITDNELRYLLWRSYENLRGRDKGIFRDAADVVKQVELKVGNYAEGGIEADYAAEPTDVGSINAQFNQELQQYEEGKLPQGHRFELGMPSAYLRSAGFPNLPISMRSTLLATKAKMNRHPFDALNLKGLVEALQKPIAIFEYSKPNMRNLIVDVKRGDKHFLVGVTLNYKAGDIEINSVSGLFPKDSLEWLKWIQDGKAIRIDQKEKVQAIIDSQRTTNTVESERIGLNLDDAAKIVKSFENPTAEGEELFRGAEGSARKEYDERVRTKVVDKEKMKNKSTNRAAQLNEAYLDSMRSLKVLQEAVSHESGKPIEDFENAYMAENEMSSRNKIAEEVYKRDFFRPMCDAVAEVTKGKDKNYRGLLDYIIAKHGLERNEYMRQKSVENGVEQSEADNTDYAGLTALTGTVNVADAERAAQQMVLDYENSHDTANLWKRINAATAESLRIRYQGGLLSKDVYEKIKTQYNYYIPLKGWKETTALDAYEYSVGGYGLSSALMTAFGRDSIADDPLATIMVDAQRTIMEANRNVMKQHFLNLALNHQTNLLTLSRQWYILDADGEWRPDDKLVIPPDADAGLVDSLVRKREQELLDLKKQGKATTRRNGLKLGMIQGDAIENQHVVKVKRNGETFCIYVNGDPRAALAINGMLNPDSGQKRREIKYAQAVKNFMSKAFTTWNPEFVVGNLSRDLMFAGVAVATKESKAYAANYTKNISSLFFNYRNMLPGLLYKWEHGELNDKVEVERLFREFLMNGGETGFTQLNTVENAKRDMQRFLKEARGGASRLPRKAWRSFWNGVEFLNRSAEDTTRFAVYMTSRQQGRSVNRSIYDAKEITVNFNKKGSGAWGAKYLNFFYVFFNAAMQALANAGRLVYRNPGKASIAMGVFMSSGFLLPLISNIMAGLWGGGDGDDDYWNMPEWVRRNNLVIYIPFTKKYLTIPIAHELRPFYGIGEIAYSILCGKETVEDGLWKAVEGFTGLLPVDYTGNGGNLKANFAPTILQPIVQVDQNVNYFGKPIYRNTPWNEDQPEWTKTYKSTSGLLVDASRMLSEALSTTDEYGVKHYPEHWYTGDVNPAVVEHLLESYTGGLGKTVNGFGKTISMLWNEDARELRNVPVARKFIQSSDERAEERRFSNEYFKLRDQYDESKKYLRELGNLDDEGAMGVANRVDKWLDTDAGKRYELMDGFFKEVNSYQRALNQENNESIRNLIQHDIDSVRHKLVATIDSLNVAEAKRQ